MRVLVLAGGSSPERDVSLDSGRCVAAALESLHHRVVALDPAASASVIREIDAKDWDIVFPVVHGTGGEDGVLQAQLNACGLAYVGSSQAASELTFDKIRTNQLACDNGFRVPESVVVLASQSQAQQLAAVLSLGTLTGDNQTGVVTKPPQQGSSIGISIVRQQSELRSGLQAAFEFDDCCLVERYIAGREVTVTVVDGVAFPAIEICPATAWYDYHAKYADDATRYVIAPPDLPDSLSEDAVALCRLCAVTGIARVDFRVDAAGNSWLLEINTVPGMTSHSLVPKSAAAIGLSLGDVCELAIRNRLQGL